jgi:protoheme IX farnesyltransferase
MASAVRGYSWWKIVELGKVTKPEVMTLVLVTTACGAFMAFGPLHLLAIVNAVFGTSLLAGGTAALNEYIERDFDAQMRRTASRPLPSGTLRPHEVLSFGIVLSLAGACYLAITLNLLTCGIGLAASLSYLFLYTPLKRRTRICTLVGAFPGAAPILMGGTAVDGSVTLGAFALFLILFLWQFPHFLAIGWIYRNDYARAGMLMLPDRTDSGRITFRLIQTTSLSLAGVSTVPFFLGMTGWVYLLLAMILGTGLLYLVGLVSKVRSSAVAKRLLHATLIYLSVLFLVMVLDKTPR